MNDHNWMEKRLGDIAFRHRDTVAPGQIENCAYIGLEHIAEGGLYLLGTGTSDDVKSA